MKKSRFLNPYKPNGKTTFPERGKSGVYLIRENGKLVYVGYSAGDLYKTACRHFQAWNHRQQEVVTYAGKMKRKSYTMRVVLCGPKRAASLEKALIKRFQPRDCQMKYEQLKITEFDKQSARDYDNSAILPTSDFVPF